MSGSPEIVDLVVQLSVSPDRCRTAETLAAALGVDQFLLFLPDPALGILIPAPGFAQTLRGGRAWWKFLAQCRAPGRHAAEVDLPEPALRPASGFAADGIAAVLIGGDAQLRQPDDLIRLLPMLAAVLRAEQRALLADAEADEAGKVTRRTQSLVEALEAARAEGARLNTELRLEHRRKDDFLAMLAHELRNPLAPLATSLELLRRRQAGSAADPQISVMTRQVRQLSRIVEDLLDVSRVSRGQIQLRPEPVLIERILADSAEATRPLLDARNHRLAMSASEPMITNGDPVRLVQIFSNLLHNAAKYTDSGGSIVVTTTREGAQALVTIRDNGIGIAKDMLTRVFDMFEQAPVSLDRSQGGLGIGLTLVRSLIRMHGGSVSATSDGVGHGSTFVVRLPLASAEVVAVPRGRQFAATGAPSVAPLRVLIVDDNEDLADSLAALLTIMGHDVRVAYSGLTALQLVGDLDPNLVFLDIGLPELDGYEIAKRMRRTVARNTRLVALTGYSSEDDLRRSREAGFDEHVVKPASMHVLEGITARASHGVQAHYRPVSG